MSIFGLITFGALALAKLAHVPVHAKGKPAHAVRLTPAAEVEQVLGRYRAAKAVRAKIKKTVTQELMGSRNVSEGRFFFAKGKLRLDLETPEKSTLVYDGQNIWLENHLDEATVQVSHLRAGALKRTDSLMASLFDQKDALKGFNSVDVHGAAPTKASAAAAKVPPGPTKIYDFEPKDKHATEIRFLQVAIRGRELERIKYKDQMENTVEFEFEDIAPTEVPVDMFSYRPPKGASVNEL